MPNAGDRAKLLSEVKHKDGVTERSARALRLKNELNVILELVVHAREALQSELSSEFAQKKLSIDKPFLDKLKGLTSCFTELTASRIRLDKAEKEMEAEMTPSEELAAIESHVASLPQEERYHFIQRLWKNHKADRDPRGARGSDSLPGDDGNA